MNAQHVVIVGLGYVGMPLAQAAARAGFKVSGFDVSSQVVEGVNRGISHIDDLSDAEIAEMLSLGFSASLNPKVLSEASVIVICVPTPLTLDGSPDLKPIESAAANIAANLQPQCLVVLESTTFPGTTEEVLAPFFAGTGKAGVDYFLAFSPERVDPGNPTYGIVNTPKVVGGVTPKCTEVAAAFYGQIVEHVVTAKGSKEAETAKLLENTYRHINIALVNEMARVCHEMDIDIWDVIRCAKTKPFGFQAFYPGPGVGGHCIPIDPNYFSFAVKTALGYPLRFVELAQEINQTMPHYVMRRTQDLLNARGKSLNGARVLIVGVTYKPDISDQRESPATEVARQLVSKGARISYLDPHVKSWTPFGIDVGQGDVSREKFDVGVVLQHHAAEDFSSVAQACDVLLDTRGQLHEGAERL